jgi:hypothetical protein
MYVRPTENAENEEKRKNEQFPQKLQNIMEPQTFYPLTQYN